MEEEEEKEEKEEEKMEGYVVIIDGELASRRGRHDQDARLLHLLHGTVENAHRKKRRERGRSSEEEEWRSSNTAEPKGRTINYDDIKAT